MTCSARERSCAFPLRERLRTTVAGICVRSIVPASTASSMRKVHASRELMVAIAARRADAARADQRPITSPTSESSCAASIALMAATSTSVSFDERSTLRSAAAFCEAGSCFAMSSAAMRASRAAFSSRTILQHGAGRIVVLPKRAESKRTVAKLLIAVIQQWLEKRVCARGRLQDTTPLRGQQTIERRN